MVTTRLDDESDWDEAGATPGPVENTVPHAQDGAPRYPISQRNLGTVEVPAVVKDVDRAVKAFGRVPSLKHTLDPERNSIPLFLNPESPFCKPLMSHNARTNNVVLKVTVPKRTGRKRKRGSDGPWQGEAEDPTTNNGEQVASHGRLDDPKLLRKKLVDNVGRYNVEAVGTSSHTHRFRGLADFYWDSYGRSDFAKRYTDQVLPGNVEDIAKFKFNPGIDDGPNADVLPPPVFTHMSLPFNYFYSQNPHVRVTDEGQLFNATATKQVGYFIGAEDPTPDAPQHPPDMTDPRTVEVMAELEAAFEERPVWTRRSLMNYLGGKLRNWGELKTYLNYAAYQFKGGPWRDGVVPYGLDPRTDPKYRVYQTVMFKVLPRHGQRSSNPPWLSLQDPNSGFQPTPSESHIFDGETYHLDGKVWQVCDITDPLLRNMLDDAAIRPTRDPVSGWYHGGLWAKVKAITKIKMVAIRFGRRLTAGDFAMTMTAGDETPVGTGATTSVLHLPSLNLTDEELLILRGHDSGRRSNYMGVSVRVRNVDTVEGEQADHSLAPPGEDELLDSERGELENDYSDSGNEEGSDA